MAMTKRTDVDGKIVCQGKARGAKTLKRNPNGSPTMQYGASSPSKFSPVKGSPPRTPHRSPVPETSPRSSPGLLASYYAGCKFTEPPSASALPLPPQHWMKSNHFTSMLPCGALSVSSTADHDFTQQLKLLLKVQA